MNAQEFELGVREVVIDLALEELKNSEVLDDCMTDDEIIDLWRNTWGISYPLSTVVRDVTSFAAGYGPKWYTPGMCVVIIYMKVLVQKNTRRVNRSKLYEALILLERITFREWIAVAKEIGEKKNAWFPEGLKKLEMVNKYRELIEVLDEEWILTSYVFDSAIQWMPKELVEDVVELACV